MITGGKPSQSGRVSSMKIEAHEDVKMVALYEGPRPKGGLGPVDINRHTWCNLCCKIGKGRNRAGHMYEPAGIL